MAQSDEIRSVAAQQNAPDNARQAEIEELTALVEELEQKSSELRSRRHALHETLADAQNAMQLHHEALAVAMATRQQGSVTKEELEQRVQAVDTAAKQLEDGTAELEEIDCRLKRVLCECAEAQQQLELLQMA
jgi:hypothetical protein